MNSLNTIIISIILMKEEVYYLKFGLTKASSFNK